MTIPANIEPAGSVSLWASDCVDVQAEQVEEPTEQVVPDGTLHAEGITIVVEYHLVHHQVTQWDRE